MNQGQRTILWIFFPVVCGLLSVVVPENGAAASSARSHPRQDNRIGAFSTFKQGDVLFVRYELKRCFGGGCFAFMFERGETFTVTMAEVPRWWTAPRPFVKDSGCTVFGTTTLSASDIKGLDALFTWYRSPRNNGCTSVDTITCTQLRQGVVIATENFVDGSCEISDHEEFIFFGELLQRVGGVR